MSVPPVTKLFSPVLNALRSLGGSAALAELEEMASELSGLGEEALEEPHVRNRGSSSESVTGTEFSYRVRWALTYLKKAGFVDNSTRGVWSLVDPGHTSTMPSPSSIVARARASLKDLVQGNPISEEGESLEDLQEPSWSDSLLQVLLKMPADAFERLAQRLLREAGFSEVRISGRTGDGGIDGSGILRLNALISMNAIFQCKRYISNVGAAEVREFRGALIGRADRGIFITTAGFTTGAKHEATRDGVTPIDLIDGHRLTMLLKDYSLGVKTEIVESVIVDADWFRLL